MVKNTVTDVRIGNFGIGNLLIKQGCTMQAFNLTDKQLMMLKLQIENHLKHKNEIKIHHDKIKASEVDHIINGGEVTSECMDNFVNYACLVMLYGKDIAECMVEDDEDPQGLASAYRADHE